MAAPTFVQEAETTWTSATSKATGTFSVLAGDILVAVMVVEDASPPTVNAPTGGSLTWEPKQLSDVSSSCPVGIWTAVVDTNKSMAVTFSLQGSAHYFGGNVFTFRNSDGVGASNKAQTTGAPSVNVTTTQPNSAIVVVNGDWDADDGASRTWRTADAGALTEQSYNRVIGNYTIYIGYHADAGAVGAKAVGLSAPSAQTYTVAAVEVKGTAGGAVSGSLSSTLAALTASGTGTVAVSGVTTATLGALAVAALGTVAVQGSVATQLANVTVSTSAAVAVQGTASSTLNVATVTASGTVGSTPIEGVLAQTLAVASVSAAGAVAVTGAVVTTLGALAATGSGVVPVTGATATTLGALTATGSGQVPAVAVLSLTLGSLSVEAAGVVGSIPIVGNLSATLGALTASSTGVVSVAGMASVELGALELAAVGQATVAGDLSSSLEVLAVAGQADVLVQGLLAQTLAELTLEPIVIWQPTERPGTSHYATQISGPTSTVLVGSKNMTAMA
jgi:hypothetical protein